MLHPADLPRRVGVLCNPHSGRNRRHLEAIRRIAEQQAALFVYHEATTPEAIVETLRAFHAEGVELIAVVGGDGTLQAALTGLLRDLALPAETLPKLLVIGGGTTNMSAADLGTRCQPPVALTRLAAWLERRGPAPHCCSRPLVRLALGRPEAAQYGLFFGSGAIQTGVDYFNSRVRCGPVAGAWGPRLAFLRVMVSMLRGRPHPLLPAASCRLVLDRDEVLEGRYLLVLVSTLERLLLGSRPFWGEQSAPLHFTAVRYPPRALWRRLPAILRGRGGRAVRDGEGYASRNLTSLRLELDAGGILDGERFRAEPGEAIELSATLAIDFLVFP
jgi:hypothetical protein